jgi:hypothetical protein
MCYEKLPAQQRVLTGDYFSKQFNYLQVTLNPCVNKVKGFCATKEEVAAFYEANSKLQFMYVDKYLNITDSEFLFD